MAKTESGMIKTFYKGQLVFKEGQHNPVAYMIKQGTVTVYKIVNNRRVVTAKLRPGQFVGEMGLITGKPFTANAEADDYVELIPFDKKLIQALLLKCPNAVQRMMLFLMERLGALDAKVTNQPTTNFFFAVGRILSLMHAALPPNDRKKAKTGVSYAEMSRTVRSILLITQAEIDSIMDKLKQLGLVTISEEKGSTYRKDIFGRVNKSSEYVKDRLISIKDPENFLNVTKNIGKDMTDDVPPYTESLEFIDMYEYAELVESSPAMIYKKIGLEEVPPNLLYFPKKRALNWAEEIGKDSLKKAKRKRVYREDLESVDDIVHLDNSQLKPVFSKLGFHKLSVLYAMAGDKAKEKILSNLSKKIAAVVREEAGRVRVDEAEIAQIQDQFFDLLNLGNKNDTPS